MLKNNKINYEDDFENEYDDFDYESYYNCYVKMSKASHKVNKVIKRPSYKGHQTSIRKGGKRY